MNLDGGHEMAMEGARSNRLTIIAIMIHDDMTKMKDGRTTITTTDIPIMNVIIMAQQRLIRILEKKKKRILIVTLD